MDFDVKTENFEKTRLSIVKLAVWLVYNAFLILYNGYRMMLGSKVKGLRAGADDYLTKPFEMEEFFARVLSLIRRYTRLNNMASKAILKYGDLRIDLESGIVELSGEELKLSAKEYDVLIYLAKNQGKILTKKQIYENVWNEEYVYDDDNIMAVISRLRKKIERTAENSYIQTVRGLGYRFNKEL